MNVLERLHREHLELEDLLGNVERAKGVTTGYVRAVVRLLHRLGRHERLEDEFLFPELFKASPACRPLVQRLGVEHKRILELTWSMRRAIDRNDPVLLKSTTHAFASLLRTHWKREEALLFPECRKALSPGRLDQLAHAAR